MMIWQFLEDESGATAIEYALIVALVSLAIVGGVSSLGNSLNSLWNDNAGRLDSTGVK